MSRLENPDQPRCVQTDEFNSETTFARQTPRLKWIPLQPLAACLWLMLITSSELAFEWPIPFFCCHKMTCARPAS